MQNIVFLCCKGSKPITEIGLYSKDGCSKRYLIRPKNTATHSRLQRRYGEEWKSISMSIYDVLNSLQNDISRRDRRVVCRGFDVREIQEYAKRCRCEHLIPKEILEYTDISSVYGESSKKESRYDVAKRMDIDVSQYEKTSPYCSAIESASLLCAIYEKCI